MDIRGKDDQLRESCGYQREVLRSETITVYKLHVFSVFRQVKSKVLDS